MAEVFAWNEAKIYLYPAGGPSAVMLFAESVSVQLSDTYIKFKNQLTGSFAARTQFVLWPVDRKIPPPDGLPFSGTAIWSRHRRLFSHGSFA